MKNIYAFVFLVIIFCLCAPPLKADEKYSVSLSSSLGFLYGRSAEIVYKTSGSGAYLSELLWDLKPLLYTGFALDFDRTNPWEDWGFLGGLSVKYGLPLKTGVIEDRDWANPDASYLTNYSRHDSYSQGALLADFFLGFSFPLSETLRLKPYLKFSYMYFSWSGQDGYIQYPKDGGGVYQYDQPWNSSLSKDPVSGPGLIYSQYWFILSPALEAEVKLSPLFLLDVYAAATPFVFCYAQDDHLLGIFWNGGKRYQDYLLWGLSLEGGAGFAFSLRENLELRIDWGFKYIHGPRGDTYAKRTGVTSSSFYLSSRGAGGAGFSALDTALTAKIRL